MVIAIKTEPLPLKVDQDGVVRVGGTRIPIDRVVYEFNTGATPEEIVLRYDTLRLDDVYFAIGYYFAPQGGGRRLSRRARTRGG